MLQKAIRGAITVEENTEESIVENTKNVLEKIIKDNQLKSHDMVSVIFTATRDLTKIYPARVARDLGLTSVPLMCMQEMYVENSLEKCIRLLITINCEKDFKVKHVYMKGAAALRPDLSTEEEVS